MGMGDLVATYNTRTKQYGFVPEFIANHKVYGRDLVPVDEDGVPCTTCGDQESETVETDDPENLDKGSDGQKVDPFYDFDSKPDTKGVKKK